LSSTRPRSSDQIPRRSIAIFISPAGDKQAKVREIGEHFSSFRFRYFATASSAEYANGVFRQIR